MVTPDGTWRLAWRELHRGYLHDVYLALIRREIRPRAHWIGEYLPRSATIELEEPCLAGDVSLALAWDEESGWRFGRFVQGDARCPTLLRAQRYIGGDVLPDPAEVGDTAVALIGGLLQPQWWWRRKERPGWGWPYPPEYRSYRDVGDGFDERLRSHLPPDDPSVMDGGGAGAG
ncbi:DUF6292 family protein [Nonomuraea endophytica]|uniref:DUF6292 family protein n=1 Tax=Nonomuraea endophytica TaxID=714136 RepID=UPI0037CC8324